MGLLLVSDSPTKQQVTPYWKGIKAMNKSQLTRITVVSIGLLVLLLSGAEARSVNLPSPQCHPSIISSMPPKIRKICDALSTIWEFSDAMENYLDEKAKVMAERRNNSVKRKGVEDVDHVFLRFGKRV